MPYSIDNPPATIQALPKDAQEIWISVFNSAFRALEGSDGDKETGARQAAWSAVKRKYVRHEDGSWVEKSSAPAPATGAKRTFVASERIVVETNLGLDGDYSALAFTPIDAGAGISANIGTNPDTGVAEAAALYFDRRAGWDVGRAVTEARRIAQRRGWRVKRAGIEYDEEQIPESIAAYIADLERRAEIALGKNDGLRAVFRRDLLKKSVADPLFAKRRIAYAEVLVPWDVDVHGDLYDEDFVADAAYDFMRKQVLGIQHIEPDEGYIAESFIVRRGDKDFDRPGAWVLGVKFSEKGWQKLLNDEITGLSIGGSWNRTPVSPEDDEAPMLEVVQASEGVH